MPPRDAPIPESENHADLRALLLELYARVNSVSAPPDAIIARFFRIRPKLVAGARGFLAATLYALLRKRYRLLLLWQWSARASPLFDWPESGEIPAVLTPVEEASIALMRWMREDLKASREDALRHSVAALDIYLRRDLPKDEFPRPTAGDPLDRLADFYDRLGAAPGLARAPEDVRRAAAASLPVDFLVRWTTRFGEREADDLARAMGDTAPLDIRVNTVLATRDQCAAALAKLGLDPQPTPHSPQGLRLGKKGNIFRTEPFEKGWFEVQDEGSQLVSLALDPHPGWKVLDACSGGGGKALHLGALMGNRGEVFANDQEEERLEPQKKRRARSGLANIRLVPTGGAAASGPYDAVLIDAPCLGLGTLRRNPSVAWRGPLARRIAETTALQETCLRAYAPLVKPGGILVYATCSFEPEETTEMLGRLDDIAPGFHPDPLAKPFGHAGITSLGDLSGHTLTLLPSVHGTDGFFIARLRRAK